MNFSNLSVSELNNLIKNIFDSEEMLFNISVLGEISSFKITRGIAYFTIKDEISSLNCVMFNATKEYSVGEKVKITGRLNYYVKLGKLSFNAYFIESLGEGDIFKKYQLLKERLLKEGLFDASSKKEIPTNVKRIGVITSSTGAVIRDIINVTRRRNSAVDIVLFDCKVQGENANRELVNAINFFSDYNVDVVIVARGGGSKEELNCFNDEQVARACFLCKKPIVSAVGHETDFTLIDLVGDLRAPTPSAAAELVVQEAKNYKAIINNNVKTIKILLDFKLKKLKSKLEKQIYNLKYDINLILNKSIFEFRNNNHEITNKIDYLIKNKANKLEILSHKIESANPKILMNKGYTKIFKNNEIAKADNLMINDEIKFNLNNVKFTAIITNKEK